jgi:uncharacterized membrane protein YuzA (DUF378 family)
MRAYRTVRDTASSDPDFARLGASLVACILGTLLMLVDNSFTLGCQQMFYVLAGLAAAYVNLRPVRTLERQDNRAATAAETTLTVSERKSGRG